MSAYMYIVGVCLVLKKLKTYALTHIRTYMYVAQPGIKANRLLYNQVLCQSHDYSVIITNIFNVKYVCMYVAVNYICMMILWKCL